MLQYLLHNLSSCASTLTHVASHVLFLELPVSIISFDDDLFDTHFYLFDLCGYPAISDDPAGSVFSSFCLKLETQI